MHAETSATQTRVQAICAAIGPYGWRALTAELVARRLLGAVDRLLILEVIGATQGGSARDDLSSIEPADGSDDRLEPLVHLISTLRWRGVALSRLVHLL